MACGYSTHERWMLKWGLREGNFYIQKNWINRRSLIQSTLISIDSLIHHIHRTLIYHIHHSSCLFVTSHWTYSQQFWSIRINPFIYLFIRIHHESVYHASSQCLCYHITLDSSRSPFIFSPTAKNCFHQININSNN